MDYFDYSYKHNYIEFSITIYRVGTYHTTGMGKQRFSSLLKGRIEMSCNDEVFTLEPLDALLFHLKWGIQIISPLREDV